MKFLEHFVVLYLSVSRVSSSTVFVPKACPVVKPIAKLDMKGLLGTWYEHARYENQFQVFEHCVVINFEAQKDNIIMFSASGIVGSNAQKIQGPVQPATNGTGLLYFHSSVYKSLDKSNEIPVAILGLDYKNYFVLYDCKYDEETKLRHDYLWILSRSKTYEGQTQKFVDNFLNTSPFVDKTKIIWQDFATKSCER